MKKTLIAVLSVLIIGTLSYLVFETGTVRKEISSLHDNLLGLAVAPTPPSGSSGTGTTTAPLATTPTSDTTPRIAYWYGRVNQHVNAQGTWLTDSDGVSGANLDKLTYCKKWFPNTTGIKDYTMETIASWQNAGNTGGPLSAAVLTTQCIQPSTIISSAISAGSTGANVLALQNYLNKTDYQVPVTSVLDTNTQIGVELFQIDNGLPVTGVVDAATMALINKGTAITPVNYSANTALIEANYNSLVAAGAVPTTVSLTNPSVTLLGGAWIYVTCFNAAWSGYASGWINTNQTNGSSKRWSISAGETLTDPSSQLTCLDWDQ